MEQQRAIVALNVGVEAQNGALEPGGTVDQ
jgi:hypothetical protein